MLTTDGSLPQQLGVVWSRLLEADSEGPSFISHAACARSVSSSRTFLSCACGAHSISRRRSSVRLGGLPRVLPSAFARLRAAWVIAGVLGVPSRSDLGEGRVAIATLDRCDVELPGVREDGMSGRKGSQSPEPREGRLGAPVRRGHVNYAA